MKEHNLFQTKMRQGEDEKKKKQPYQPPVFQVVKIKTEGSFCSSVVSGAQNPSEMMKKIEIAT